MRDRTGRVTIIYIFTILSILILSFGCSNGGSSGGQNRGASDKGFPPDFTAKTIDGEEITLSNYRGEKAVLIDLWATWCAPCKKEMPELQEIYEKYSNQMEILAVSTDKASDIGKIRDFVESNKLTFKIIHDTTQDIARKYPSRGIPYMIIMNKEGKKIKTYLGYQENLTEKLEKLLGLE